MTNETAQARLQQLYNDFLPTEYDFTEYDTEDAKLDREALQMGIKALEQQPCEDCISRTEALKHSHIEYDDDGEGHRVIYVEDIEELQSVTPKRPKGNWKPLNYKDEMWGYVYKCSNCGATEYEYNYCPNCGAKMVESEDEK